MKHTFFEIKNFKGIESLRLDFEKPPTSRVITLVGLNESGKTTILEAINFFAHKPESVEALNIHGYEIADVHDVVPVSKRSNFTDTTSIKAGYSLSRSEQKELRGLIEGQLHLVTEHPISEFALAMETSFANSEFQERKSTYHGLPRVRSKRAKTFRGWRNDKEEFGVVAKWLSKRLPPIVYFPNFLFAFPQRIYLERVPADEDVHLFYRKVLQRILQATDPSFDLTEHVLNRVKSSERNVQRALESLLAKISGQVTETVFSAWNSVFSRGQAGKEIRFQEGTDDRGLAYIELKIRDGTDLFDLTERSLGFRWFFTFLLLTHYLGTDVPEDGSQLFLFDEPASNLHSSAQRQLLESFDRFHPEARIIYTTHSHHMINPGWLESAYVVKNEGMTYDDSADGYSARESRIGADRYRVFAARHPDQTTYYQPILDVLEYRPSNLEMALPAVFFEGKNDSYTLTLAAVQTGLDLEEVCLMPGTGSGNLDEVLRLYLGWARPFILLLDADKEGKKQKKRYEECFGLAVADRIFTLADIDPELQGKGLERIVPEGERLSIQRKCFPESQRLTKDSYNRALQQLLQQGAKDAFEDGTASTLGKLLKDALEKLGAQCVEG